MYSLIPLLVAAAMLLGSNGIQSTLIAIRANLEGMSPAMIGAMGTAYFAGYVGGALMATRLISFVGHIRVFAALAAIAASAVLVFTLSVEPRTWIAVRFVTGFCSAALFIVIESWLNGVVSNQARGRVFSAYSLVDITAVTASQFLLPSLGAETFVPFSVMSMLLALALVPIALSPTAQPAHDDTVRMHLWDTWRISPLAFAACLTIGLTNSAFRTIGPLYARQIGLDLTGIAIFMGVGILGGAFLQIPFGWLSDRIDRRSVLMVATLGASLSALALSLGAGNDHRLVYGGAFLFGAFAMPLYSLAAAHANDFAKPGQYAALSAGLLFTFAVGSMIGPLAASLVMERLGPQGLFTYTAAIHACLIVWALIRTAIRPTVPMSERVKHVPVIRSTPTLPQGDDILEPAPLSDTAQPAAGG
ncbi:MAG: MFS transporter [Hyphomicrobiaceae bacterium]